MKLLKQRLTSSFGERINPIYKNNEFHTGVDLVDDTFRNVWNTYGGYVRKSRFGKWGEGNYIQIRSDIKDIIFFHNYFHNEKNLVQEGININDNQIIATQGETGNTTGRHTHYEIFIMENELSKDFAKDLIKYVKYKKIGKRIFFDPFVLYLYFHKKGIA